MLDFQLLIRGYFFFKNKSQKPLVGCKKGFIFASAKTPK